MKKYFEIFLVILVLSIIVYSLLYRYYFDSLCSKYSGREEANITTAIFKLGDCKDSLVCYPSNIKVNKKNELSNWSCLKKESPIFGIDLYINTFKYFTNSRTE